MISYPIPKNINKNLKNNFGKNIRLKFPFSNGIKKNSFDYQLFYNDQKDIDSLMNALQSMI